MNEYYYELRITPSSNLEDFENFVFDESGGAIETEDETVIVRSEEGLDELALSVKEYAKELGEIFGEKIEVKTELSKKKNEDWVQSFKDGFSPITVGGFHIRASWHDEVPEIKNLIVDPALAFGTGHHPTTKNCILMVDKYVKSGDTFLDVGCGSGILSLCAASKGAVVDMCDTDELAVGASEENFAKNDLKFNKAWVGSVGAKGEYDIITANIIADILSFLSDELIANLKSGGKLILSGILDKYEMKMHEAFGSLVQIDRVCEEEWVTLVYEKA